MYVCIERLDRANLVSPKKKKKINICLFYIDSKDLSGTQLTFQL